MHERARIYFRYHAARRRTVAGLQHDGPGESCAWRASWWSWAWTFWRPAFPSPRRAISRRWRRSAASFPGRSVAALARCCTLDVERAAKSLAHARQPAHPHLHRHQRYSSEIQAEEDRGSRCWKRPWRPWNWPGVYVDDVEFSAEDGARTDADYLERDLASGGGGRRAHRQHPRYGGLFDAARIRRADRPAWPGRWAIAPSSACTAMTTWAWRWPTRSPPSRPARGRWSAPSTASASAPATARSKKWS